MFLLQIINKQMFVLECLYPSVGINFIVMMHQHALGFKTLYTHLYMWNKKLEITIIILLKLCI